MPGVRRGKTWRLFQRVAYHNKVPTQVDEILTLVWHTYKLGGKKVTFKVTADKTTKVTVKNAKEPEAEKTGTLCIVKSAAGTGAWLSGVVFAVYDSKDKKLADLTTGSDGVKELDLAPATYYLKETKALEGFKLEIARIPFTITADSRTVVEVTN